MHLISFNFPRYFLCLFAGMPIGGYQLPKALGNEEEMEEEPHTVNYSKYRKSIFRVLTWKVNVLLRKRRGEKASRIKIGF